MREFLVILTLCFLAVFFASCQDSSSQTKLKQEPNKAHISQTTQTNETPKEKPAATRSYYKITSATETPNINTLDYITK